MTEVIILQSTHIVHTGKGPHFQTHCIHSWTPTPCINRTQISQERTYDMLTCRNLRAKIVLIAIFPGLQSVRSDSVKMNSKVPHMRKRMNTSGMRVNFLSTWWIRSVLDGLPGARPKYSSCNAERGGGVEQLIYVHFISNSAIIYLTIRYIFSKYAIMCALRCTETTRSP